MLSSIFKVPIVLTIYFENLLQTIMLKTLIIDDNIDNTDRLLQGTCSVQLLRNFNKF